MTPSRSRPVSSRPRVAREVGQIARRRQHALGAPRDLGADLGQDHVAGPPLDQLHAEVLLQIADLHGQRRLGHGAGLGGPAEMPVLGQRGQIAQLLQGDHRR